MKKIISNIESRRMTNDQIRTEKMTDRFLALEVVLKGQDSFTISMSNDPSYKMTSMMFNLPITIHGVLFTYYKN